MKTKEQIKSELLATNPSRKYVINDVEFEQTDEEFEDAINNCVEMIYENELAVEEFKETQAKREALLARLGITEEEASLLAQSL